jgi:4-diphosphocytidyl-2-C-methyl-D-erythritol kinase
VKIEKAIPLAAGLGGGSSDAATALRLANETLAAPLPPAELHTLAAGIGADVPFFLADGPQRGSGDGSELAPIDLPQDFWVVVLLPREAVKSSTAAVYAAFDARNGAAGWEERRQMLLDGLARVARPKHLAGLPPNDLASSPLAAEILAAGAFRADVSGAGPALYGLFGERADADAARRSLSRFGETWLAPPAWYG